jgi:hypothetical protein
MGAEKISQFYDDPVKRRSDEQALKAAHYRRSLTVDTSLPWKLRRGRSLLRRRTLGWIDNRLHSFWRAA